MKTYLLRNTILLFLTAAIATACSRKSVFTSEAPDAQPPMPAFEPRISVINVPVSFNVKQLETRLNKDLWQELYKDDNINDDNYKLTITRTGKIGITADNDLIYFTLPIHIWAMGQYKWEPCSFCPSISKSQSSDFDLIIKTQSSLSLTPNWQVKTKTTGNYEWGKTPAINIGPISIPISGILDLALKPQVSKLTAMFDQEVQNRINIKDYVMQAWTGIQQPILLNADYKTWMVIKPQDIKVTSLQCKSDQMSMKIGIKSYIRTVTGEKPNVILNKNLPALGFDNALGDDFRVGLVSDISYGAAAELLKKQLAGQVFTFENKYKISVNDLSLEPSGNRLLVKAGVTGKTPRGKSVTGNVFMLGTPYYDPATMSVMVKDLDFDIKTRNALAKTAGWIASTGFTRKIQEYMVFPVKDNLLLARKMVQDGLNGTRLGDNAMLKGTLGDLTPEGIYLTQTGISTVVNASGKVTVEIDKL